MNWVGGSRSRVLIKQERRKQKEYFERNKLKSKMKLLGVFPPVKNPTVSLDLLNLYMVNQISSKKTSENMKRPTYVNMNRDLKIPLRRHNLELPMSPHRVPSKLCIDDMESNVPNQRLCSKEETGPVHSSQDMNSYRMFSKTENNYISPSFAAELPSNRYIPNQNFTSRIAPSPRKFTYEKNQNKQFSNGNLSDSLFSKLNNHPNDFSSSQNMAEFETSFERINGPETGNLLSRRSVIMGEDCRSLCGRRQPDFATEKTPVQKIWANHEKEFPNFFEDVIQPTQRQLLDNHDSFVSHNMIDLLSRDPPGRRATFNTCGSDSLSDTRRVSSDESYSTGGCTKGNFTVPQVTFHNPTFNMSYIEMCQSNKPYEKEYNNNEINEFRRSFEKECYPTSCGRRGKIESDDQEKALQTNIEKYSVYAVNDIPLKELHHKQSRDSDHHEVPMEGRRLCPLKGKSISTEKIYLESSQSSQSASYSPRPTESTFSSSSDLISEDEDQILQQTQDSNKKATETTDNFCLEKTADHLDNINVKGSVKIHKQNDNFCHSSVKNNTDKFSETQCNSEHTAQNKATSNRMPEAGRCDLGVQTETEPVTGKTADAAVQCTIISQCSCERSHSVLVKEVPSLHKADRCSDDIAADTTGGQEILRNNSF